MFTMPYTNLSVLPGVTWYDTDASGDINRCDCAGAPSSLATTAGYFAVGCVAIDTTTGKAYSNQGTLASPSWNSIGDVAVSEISLAEGKVMIGDATGLGTATTLSAGKVLMGDSSNKAVATTVSGDVVLTSAGVASRVTTAYNTTGVPIAAAKLVRVKGNSNGTAGIVLADSNSNLPATHIVTAEIADTASGAVYENATVTGIDTSTAVGVGSPVYLSTSGAIVLDTPPVGADVLTQQVGVVLVKNVNGSVQFNVVPPTVLGTSNLKASSVTATKIGASFALSGAPAFTGDALAGHAHTTTATGSVAAPVFTGDALAGHSHTTTATGSVAAPVFTGDALAGHDHTVSAASSRRGVSLWQDIKGSLNTDSENADSASGGTNGTYVAAETAVAVGVWAVGAITSPDVPRNVLIQIRNDSGGPLNLFEGVMTFTVSGTDIDGGALQENVTYTSSAINKAIANTQFRLKYGLKPFFTVTNVVLDNVPDNGLKISVGLGSKVLLIHALSAGIEADVLRAAVNATNYSVSGKVDGTNNTLNYGTLSDGDDISAVVQSLVSISATSSSVSGGTPSGSNSAPNFTGNAVASDSVSGGTPSGSNSAPAFTGNAVASDSISGGTPSGSNSTPTINVT